MDTRSDLEQAPGIALNEDNSHYFFTRAGQELTESAVDRWLVQYAGTPEAGRSGVRGFVHSAW